MNRPTFAWILFLIFTNMTINLSAQDWANLNRYRADNENFPVPYDGNNRIVLMGNSITEGWSNHYPEFFENKLLINRGISGQTSPQMLLRFRQDVIDLKPAIVVILAGTNDIAGNTGPSSLEMIMDNIISMTELAHTNKITVILCSVVPAFDFPWKPGLEPAEKIENLNKMIKAFAEENGIHYLDYYSTLVDQRKGLNPLYSEDGVHPNKAGYIVMSGLLDEAIKTVLQAE